MYPAGGCSERWTSRVTDQGLLSFKFQLSLLGDIQLSCHWGASSYFNSKQIRLMCQVLWFSGVSPDGNCAYVHWGSFTSNSRSVRRAIWFTWFSEPHECIQHLAVPDDHPSNLESGATLLNFSDRANHDERTPYSVYSVLEAKGFFQFEIITHVLVSSFWFIWIPMLWVCGPLGIFLILQRGDQI